MAQEYQAAHHGDVSDAELDRILADHEIWIATESRSE